jgi:hypothetical protein
MDGRILIDTYKGEVNVSTWDQPEVEIYARIEADHNFFDGDEEWMVKNTEVLIDESDSYLKIKSDYSQVERHRNGHSFLGLFGVNEVGSLPFVKYFIKIPRDAKLKIKDYKSDIKTNNTSDIDLDTYKGEVRIYKLNGRIELKTYKGNAEIEFNNIKDNCYFDTYKGKIDIKIPGENKFDLKVNLDNHADFYSNFDINTRSDQYHKHNKGNKFDASINGGGPRIELKSHKGDIQVRKI